MASILSAVLRLHLPNYLSPHLTLHSPRISHHAPSLHSSTPLCYINSLKFKSSRTVPFAVTESDSPKSLEPDPQALLQEVAVSSNVHPFRCFFFLFGLSAGVDEDNACVLLSFQDSFVLPADFFSRLPRDLRLDVSLGF